MKTLAHADSCGPRIMRVAGGVLRGRFWAAGGACLDGVVAAGYWPPLVPGGNLDGLHALAPGLPPPRFLPAGMAAARAVPARRKPVTSVPWIRTGFLAGGMAVRRRGGSCQTLCRCTRSSTGLCVRAAGEGLVAVRHAVLPALCRAGRFPAAGPARERACRTPWPGSSVRRPRWPAPGPRQMPAVSIIGTLAPAEEAEVPGVSLAAGRTLQADGGNHDRGHDGNFRCDANWCRRYCRCNSGGHHCGGGGLVFPGFPLNAGSQLGRCPFS